MSETCPIKCVFCMSGDEILAQHVAIQKPARSLLIVDKGHGWEVTMFGPENAGLPATCKTIQQVVERVECDLVNLRRQADHIPKGEVITDPDRIVDELVSTGLFKVRE